MEDIGIRLRSAREARKIPIKEVAKETNISPFYLEALENEEFDKIPGETYIVGFLRNYAEYLKLDPDDIIQSYKGYKIGESTTPLEELTKPTTPAIMSSLSVLFNQYKNIIYIAGASFALLLLIWGVVNLFSSDIDVKDEEAIKNIKTEYKSLKNGEIENIKNLQLANDKGFVLVYTNETVQFMVDNKEVMFMLKEIKENSVKLEILPGKTIERLEMEKPAVLNLKDTPRDVFLTLKGLTENRAKLFVMLGAKSVPVATVQENGTTAPVSDKVVAQNRGNLKIVFEAEITKKTYLELYLDGVQKKKGIYLPGTKERWEASEVIQVKIGNAGGLKAKINGKDYAFGLPGQVANKVVTWKKDEKNPNLYYIVVKDW